jgi:hypothetical protein
MALDWTSGEILRAEGFDSPIWSNNGIADSDTLEVDKVESFMLLECFEVNVFTLTQWMQFTVGDLQNTRTCSR